MFLISKHNIQFIHLSHAFQSVDVETVI